MNPDQPGSVEMAGKYCFFVVQALPLLGADEAELAALGVDMQYPGDFLHGPQRHVGAIHVTIALGDAYGYTFLETRAEYVFVAVGRSTHDYAAFTRVAKARRIGGSSSLKHFDLVHVQFPFFKRADMQCQRCDKDTNATQKCSEAPGN